MASALIGGFCGLLRGALAILASGSPKTDPCSCFALLYLFLLSSDASDARATAGDDRVLARMEIAWFQPPLALPVHALLQDSEGRDYALVLATEAELERTGNRWRRLARGVAPEACVLATARRAGAGQRAAGAGTVLYDDGLNRLVRASDQQAEALAEAGFGLERLTPEPIAWPLLTRPLPDDRPFPKSWPEPLVPEMLATIQATNLYGIVARLSGVQPVLAGGRPRLITSRHTVAGAVPLSNALDSVFARFDVLGLRPAYQLWSASSYTNRNLWATLPGGARSNELVLITAHLDDMPYSTGSPGADDNASGCAAVLTAAGVFSQYSFERTIRFVLFTGEEQGLKGSTQYAAAAHAAQDNIIAVLNLDMIAWDSVPPSTFQLHVRGTSNPGYSNDLAIAAAFTNAVATYGLTNITPVIKPDSIFDSDHAAFWGRGFPAAVATEDYTSDMNRYYHTPSDTVTQFNMPYFTDAVRAAVATVAHLAQPVARIGSRVLEVADSDWSVTSGIGESSLVLRHLAGASESGPEALDLALAEALANPNPHWLKAVTSPYGFELATDSRPTLSESVFTASLAVAADEGLVVACSNQLRFDFLSPPGPERIYLARVRASAEFTLDHTEFLCITNLRDVVACGGYVRLPHLVGAGLGREYGTCEIAPRLRDTSAAACQLKVAAVTESNLVFATQVQAGSRIRDDIEYATQLPATNWTALASFQYTNAPDGAAFEAGWQPVAWSLGLSGLPPSSCYLFRLKRSWLGY